MISMAPSTKRLVGRVIEVKFVQTRLRAISNAVVVLSVILLISVIGSAQDASAPSGQAASQSAKTSDSTSKQQGSQDAADPLQRTIPDKEKQRNAKALRQELSNAYKRWLNEDVVYIITPEELTAFKRLTNDEERDQFIEQFWLRRDPTPDTPENEFREEHYRRIAAANEKFPAGRQGWRTDRGRIYIIWGPPDEIERHPTGGYYNRPMEEGGGDTSTFPFEDWHYRNLEGIGQDITLEFVDPCICNDYHLTSDPNEKDALLHTPTAGNTEYENMGLASRTDRMNPFSANPGPMQAMQNAKIFDKMNTLARVQAPPPVKFKDLEEVVNHKIMVNLLPFEAQTDYVKVTGDTVLVPVTIEVHNKDITFAEKDGIQRGAINIFGRVTGLTGRVAQTFEDTVQVDVPQDLLEKTINRSSLYWKAIPLRPGRYRLDIVVKDVNGDRAGTWSRGILVPEYSDDKLASSSLILADHLERTPSKDVGTGSFVIGETKLAYPRLGTADGKPPSFSRDKRMSFWMQVYNLQTDEKTKKPSATFKYDIVNVNNSQHVLQDAESTELKGSIGEQVTLEKTVVLNNIPPGVYKLTVKVEDNLSKQQIEPSINFVVQ
jgi:GWxTD domain-containing protein